MSKELVETWKPSPIYPQSYEISNTGMVRNKKSKVALKPQIDRKGYQCVRLSCENKKQSARVHRLVALAFINNSQHQPQVNHIDGNKKNNNVENLEWISNLENMKHAINMGQYKHSDNAGRPHRSVVMHTGSIDDHAVRFKTIAEAESITGTSRSNIVAVCKGRRPRANGYIWNYESEMI